MSPKPVLALFALLILAVLGSLFEISRRTEAPRFFGPSDELAIAPDPAAPGPYDVCPAEDGTPGRDYGPMIDGVTLAGRIYAPVRDTTTCETVRREFNLVLIMHADGANNDFTDYEELATHLASNAMIVVSIDRKTGSDDGGVTIRRTLQYLYGPNSGVADFLSDNVALIGHSAGGRAVINNADEVADFGKTLRAVILMSPTVDFPPVSFTGITPALLLTHVVMDTDPIAYGAPDEANVMKSAFKIYDEGGITNDANVFSLEKDMVFAPVTTHYYQDRLFLRTYVNAFLQNHLNGHAEFQRFFKFQETPPSDMPSEFDGIRLQHEDTSRLVIDNFADGDPTSSVLGPITAQGALGPLEQGTSFQIDRLSPHSTGLLKFAVDGDAAGTNPRIRFGFDAPLDLTDWRFFGLRIAQAFDPDINTEGVPQEVRVVLRSADGGATVRLSEVGELVPFPTVVSIPFGNTTLGFPAGVTAANGGTKNAMASYLIRLTDFDGVDLSAVTELRLAFQNVEGQTIFVVDDLAFYRF